MAIPMVVVVSTVVKGVVLRAAGRVFVVSSAVVRQKGALQRGVHTKAAVARGVRRKVRAYTMAAAQRVAIRRAVNRGVMSKPVARLAEARRGVRLRPAAVLPIAPVPGKRLRHM